MNTDTLDTMQDKKHILIVEDDIFLSRALKEEAETYNFSVSVVNDGVEAMDLLRKRSFDVMILDILMPNKNGFEVMEEMADIENPPVCLVLTNIEDKAELDKIRKESVCSVFVKANTSLEQVIAEVRKLASAQGNH